MIILLFIKTSNSFIIHLSAYFSLFFSFLYFLFHYSFFYLQYYYECEYDFIYLLNQDGELDKGSSGDCETFMSPCLASTEDFTCSDCELYGIQWKDFIWSDKTKRRRRRKIVIGGRSSTRRGMGEVEGVKVLVGEEKGRGKEKKRKKMEDGK